MALFFQNIKGKLFEMIDLQTAIKNHSFIYLASHPG